MTLKNSFHCDATTLEVEAHHFFKNPKVGIHAYPLDEFDLAAVPVTVIDGRHLW